MTRLTGSDVLPLRRSMAAVGAGLEAATGRSLAGLAAAASGLASLEGFGGATAAVVPVTAGQGAIPGFAEAVAAILRYLGVPADVTDGRDVSGLAEALDRHPDAVFMADDDAFIAFDPTTGRYSDNGPATGRGFAQALHEAAGGVAGRRVLVIGLGPVGAAAAAQLSRLGAEVMAAEVAQERVDLAVRDLGDLRPVGLEVGLDACDLVVDAAPTGGLIPDEWVRPGRYVAAPGLPLGLSAEAAHRLGNRLIHEPLAIGVAVMLGSLLADREGHLGRLPVDRPAARSERRVRAEGR